MTIKHNGNQVEIVPMSGHRLEGEHIERPIERFRIDWDCPHRMITTAAGVAIVWPNCKRYAFCLAETAEGAIKIAQYHHGTYGTNFIATQVEMFK